MTMAYQGAVGRVRRSGGMSGLLVHLSGWYDRVASRNQLVNLDDRMLRDIGLTRADVDQELSKPFWR